MSLHRAHKTTRNRSSIDQTSSHKVKTINNFCQCAMFDLPPKKQRRRQCVQKWILHSYSAQLSVTLLFLIFFGQVLLAKTNVHLHSTWYDAVAQYEDFRVIINLSHLSGIFIIASICFLLPSVNLLLHLVEILFLLNLFIGCEQLTNDDEMDFMLFFIH